MISKGKHDKMWYYLTSFAFRRKNQKIRFSVQVTVQWCLISQEKMNSEPEAWNQALMKVQLDPNLKTQKIKSLVFFSGDSWESYFYSGRMKNFEALFLKVVSAKCPGVSYICTFVTLNIENRIKWINNSWEIPHF